MASDVRAVSSQYGGFWNFELVDLLDVPYQNVAVVDRFQPFMDGTVILAHGDSASARVLKRGQSTGRWPGPDDVR